MQRNEVAQHVTKRATLTSQEIWSTIRYLDPDVRRIRVTALSFVVVVICFVALAFYFRTA